MSGKVCRTCLKVSGPSEIFLNINHKNYQQEVNFRDKLRKCVPEMRLGENESAEICQSCVVLLESSYLFRNMCLCTEEKLKQISSAFYTDLVKLAAGSSSSAMGEAPRNTGGTDSTRYVLDIEQNLAISIGEQQVHVQQNLMQQGNNRRKSAMTDQELIRQACRTIPALRNISPSMLDCRVSMEKIRTPEKRQRAIRTLGPPRLHPVAEEKPEKPENTEKAKKPQRAAAKRSLERIANTEKKEVRRKRLDGYYSCKYCKKTFPSVSKTISHERRVHTKEKPFACPVCRMRFYERYLMNHHRKKEHENLENNPNTVLAKNDMSEDGVKTGTSIRRFRARPTRERPYACSVCQMKFYEKYLMVRHKRKNHGNSHEKGSNTVQLENNPSAAVEKDAIKAETVTEGIASGTADLNVLVKQEIIEMNEEDDPLAMQEHKCNLCQATFASEEERSTHAQTHISFGCSFCGELFNSMEGKAEHQQLHKSGSRFWCFTCSAEFANKDHFNVHTGNKPYRCEVCSKSFGKKSNLYNHKFVHMDELPYKCDRCKKGFGHRYLLMRHKRSGRRNCRIQKSTAKKNEPEEAPLQEYDCKLCNEKFDTEVQMQAHTCSSSERIFNCEICKENLTGRNRFIEHVKRHFCEHKTLEEGNSEVC